MSNYDIIVVGAGAAGLMAAGSAAENNKKVLLLEKMERPARKLRITGKGRCNITNNCSENEFIDHFGKEGRFLRQAFSKYFVKELLDFFNNNGLKTVVERGNRVFPVSQNAEDVINVLINWNKKLKVNILNNHSVSKIIVENNKAVGVELVSGEQFLAEKIIVTTGGASYPATGSTGDGYKMAENVGHKIVGIRPALVPLNTKGNIAKKLQGLSLKNVTASVWANSKKKRSDFGEMLFTHFGLSGPIILTLSSLVVDLVDLKQIVEISIDLKPKLDDEKLNNRLLRDIKENGKKKIATYLKQLLPSKLIDVCCEVIKIDSEKLVHQITAQERKKLRLFLKDFRFEIENYRSFKEAIITAGGIKLKEIDPRSMQSRIVKDLYFAGEILDLNGDTGGFNLQEAFSTGWLAGKSAAGIEY